jgi:hypothetical protein
MNEELFKRTVSPAGPSFEPKKNPLEITDEDFSESIIKESVVVVKTMNAFKENSLCLEDEDINEIVTGVLVDFLPLWNLLRKHYSVEQIRKYAIQFKETLAEKIFRGEK